MQPALSNQSVHSVMHFEIEFHRLILFTATPAIWLGCVCNVRAHNASFECLLKIGIMLKWSYYNYIKRMHWKSDCCGFTEPLISRHTSCTTTRAWDAFLMPLKNVVYAPQTGSFGEDLQFQIGNVKRWILSFPQGEVGGWGRWWGGGGWWWWWCSSVKLLTADVDNRAHLNSHASGDIHTCSQRKSTTVSNI